MNDISEPSIFAPTVREHGVEIPDPIDIFIGYDAREAAAYHVCVQSILSRATAPLRITPLALNTIQGYFEQHTDGSNAFTYSRFLIPWLCKWNGWAIYLDGDMILRADIADLWKLRRPHIGASVVKHDYLTKHPVKYLGAKNEDYPRKNWSSVMLWNCGYFRNRKLTPDFIANQPGSYLHRLLWLDDEQIGELPGAWNHLTMEQESNDKAKLLHFTIGTPCFAGYDEQEGADEWWQEYRNATVPVSEQRV